MHKIFSLSRVIATCFGIGYVPFAPGTFGAILAFPLYMLLTYLLSLAKSGVIGISATELVNSLLVVTTGLFFIGAWAADQYSEDTGKQDPKEVIIDEVVGQLLTICLIIFLLPYIGGEAITKFKQHGFDEYHIVIGNFISGFILFRVFDIMKPWPIDYIDKNYKNGLGVMFDDVLAAVFAVVMNFFILYAIIERL